MSKPVAALSIGAIFIAGLAAGGKADDYKIPSFQAAVAGFDTTIGLECDRAIYIVKLWDVVEWTSLGWFAFGPPYVQQYTNPWTGADAFTSADGFNLAADGLIRHIGLWNNPVRLFLTGQKACGGRYPVIAPVVVYDSRF